VEKTKTMDGFMSGLSESVPSVVVPRNIFVKAVAEIPASVFDAGNDDEILFLRHKSKPYERQPLTFEFTRDPGLLQQYRVIYEREFQAVQNAPQYRAISEEHDRNSHFLIIRQGNMCVGGARLTTKSPRQPHLLPVEMGDFRIEKHFPHMQNKTYGQIGRVCLLPEFRGGDVTKQMFEHFKRKAVALGWEVTFATAPLLNARNNTKLCRAVGLETKIHFDIDIPLYPMCEEVKMYFMTISVNKALIKDSSLTTDQKNCDSLHPLEA
jgi:predicted GNAT family N-acyltransferase